MHIVLKIKIQHFSILEIRHVALIRQYVDFFCLYKMKSFLVQTGHYSKTWLNIANHKHLDFTVWDRAQHQSQYHEQGLFRICTGNFDRVK